MKTTHYFCNLCLKEQERASDLKVWAVCTEFHGRASGVSWIPIFQTEVCRECEKKLSTPVREANNKTFSDIKDKQERRRLEVVQEQTVASRLIDLINEIVVEQTQSIVDNSRRD